MPVHINLDELEPSHFQREISGLGVVKMRSVSIGVMRRAREFQKTFEESQRAEALVNFVATAILIEPALTPNDIPLLPSDTQQALMESVRNLIRRHKIFL
jgi:hypothetical protein